MSVFRSLGVVSWAWRRVAGRLADGRAWIPFLALAAVQLLLLGLLLSFHRSSAAGIALPVVRWIGGEAATHYPTFFSYLPAIFERLDLAVGILLASLAEGAATLLFARAFGYATPNGVWGTALRRYPALLLYSAALTAIVFATLALQQLVPQDVLLGSRAARWGTRLGFLLVFIVIQSLLVYGTAYIVLRGSNGLVAMARSLRLASGRFLTTMALVALPVLIQYPLAYLRTRGDLLTEKLDPELMAWVLGAGIVVQMLVGFLLIGSITAVFVRSEEAPS